ncbi:DinB family protein [Chitinophaga sp. 212800010-3]|uniref:DinB family protein n=1 Tax=unclassified Chitinophaga TaxID=2619133 RepID=UPI002DEC2F23|nr:DinB family protein [Chitinophaga sp. 212800010-3]
METVSIRMRGILPLYDMQTSFYPKVLDGISDDDAHKRLETQANHVAWLAGSLVQQRFDTAGLLGVSDKSFADELFSNFQGIKNGQRYPSLETYKKDWEKITPLLREKLAQVTDEQLDRILQFPGMSMPLWDLLAFNSYREANCIGQIALWRRLLDYPAMKYM